MTFSQLYYQGFKDLGLIFLNWVHLGKLTEENLTPSRVAILNTIYWNMVAKKEITELEKLPEKVKKELWEISKPYTKHVSKKDKIKFAKAVYAINAIAKTHAEGTESI